ncbi:hypothetical protein ACHAXT_008419 [Thalassiosira profunda]
MRPSRALLALLPAAALSPRHFREAFAFSSIALRADGRPPSELRAGLAGGFDDALPQPDEEARPSGKASHIVSITSSNIAGMTNDGDGADINIDFGPSACLVGVTGESGSGKSLLVSKAIDLATGGKAAASLVPAASMGEDFEKDGSSSVELVANLCEPHLSAVSATLQRFGIDPSMLHDEQSNAGRLHLQRTLSSTESGRLKSVCRINGKHISLKTLRQIAAPLFTRVDVAVASAALGRAPARLAMLDRGVAEDVKRRCVETRESYREAKKRRERIQRELESRVLPSSLQTNANGDGAGLDEDQMKLLGHWVEELDAFETRMAMFQENALGQYSELASGESNVNEGSGSGGIVAAVQKLRRSKWGEVPESDDDCLFTALLDFREEIKVVETQLVSATAAYESLASLTAPNSAQVALENTRKLLYGISGDDSGPLFETIEKTHELLNDVEASLNDCARSIDGNSDSLVSTLEKMAFDGCSMEEVDGIIADWNSMARKHGISPYSLPNCHRALRDELDGNVEALKLLPEAEEDERLALEDYSRACEELSDARRKVAVELSESVTSIMPSLGLEGSTLQVQMGLRPGGFEQPYYGSESVGVDTSDFLLLHQKVNGDAGKDQTAKGGNIEQVGSSGEKSRVLLAIETALPGSIGSTCNALSNSGEIMFGELGGTPPISIVYDEIDAHVGGRAAVTMAKLLADQSRRRTTDDNAQIIAITHSASLAAIADRHIVVERGARNGSSSMPIRAYAVDGSSRRKEIARMASGDLATGEAENFAEALIRDALLQKEATPS